MKTTSPSSDNPNDLSRSHLPQLRLLTGWLEGMTFAETAIVVGMERAKLRAVLHGQDELEPGHCNRIERMAAVTCRIRSLISHQKVGWWYRVSIPRLNGKSPLELLKNDRVADVERLVDSYFDTSYS